MNQRDYSDFQLWFSDGPWHERYKMCTPDCTGTPASTTTYFADTITGSYSEKVVSGSTTIWRDYIVANGQIVALRTTGATVSTVYIIPDHLGSTSVITDASATVTAMTPGAAGAI